MKKLALLSVAMATTALTACSGQYDHNNDQYGRNATESHYGHHYSARSNRNESLAENNMDRDHMRGQDEGRDCWKEKAARYWFDKMDLNRDHKVSRSEYLAFARKMFDESDRNHNGSLTMDELKEDHMKEWQKMEGALSSQCPGHHHWHEESMENGYGHDYDRDHDQDRDDGRQTRSDSESDYNPQ